MEKELEHYAVGLGLVVAALALIGFGQAAWALIPSAAAVFVLARIFWIMLR